MYTEKDMKECWQAARTNLIGFDDFMVMRRLRETGIIKPQVEANDVIEQPYRKHHDWCRLSNDKPIYSAGCECPFEHEPILKGERDDESIHANFVPEDYQMD